MAETYDQYYQTANLFGLPYPELIRFLAEYPVKGKLLDLGCGQGRDALALARLGYTVTGIDRSQVGIDQMNQLAAAEKLPLTGQVGDVYVFDAFEAFEVILLDSMFHFEKKDQQKEIGLIKRIVSNIKPGCLLVVCLQDTAYKVDTLTQALDHEKPLARLADKAFTYAFEDAATGHKSETAYRMIAAKKG